MAAKQRTGPNQTYQFTPVSDNDTYLTPEMVQRVKDGQQEIREGKSTVIRTKDQLDKFFDNL